MCFAQGLGPAVNVKMYVSHVPDSQAWETDALNVFGEGLVSYVQSPSSLKDSTDDHLQVENHHDWVSRDFLVLGSGESVHKTSLRLLLQHQQQSSQ